MAISLIPEQAMMGFGAELAAQGRSWGEELIRSEHVRQTSNARAEYIKQRDLFWRELDKTENQAIPGEWDALYEKSKDKMREAIFAHVRQPGAKQYIEGLWAEKSAALAEDIHEGARRQMAKIATEDFQLQYNNLTTNVPLANVKELKEHLEAIGAHVKGGDNDGNPYNDVLLSPAVTQEYLDTGYKQKISSYLMQHPGEDGADILNINAFLKNEGIDVVQFDLDEIAELKKSYNAERNAVLRQAENERAARAEQKEDTITTQLLKGQFSMTDEAGREINLRQMIIDDPDFSPATKRILENLYTEMSKPNKDLNFFKQRGSETKYFELLQKAQRKTLKGDEMARWVGLKDGISTQDYEHLSGMIKTGVTSKDSDLSEAGELIKELITNVQIAEEVFEDETAAREMALHRLDLWRKDHPDENVWELKKEAVRLVQDLKTRAGEMTWPKILKKEASEESKKHYAGLDRAKLERLDQELTGVESEMTEITTAEEFNALPSGTRFIYKGIERVKK